MEFDFEKSSIDRPKAPLISENDDCCMVIELKWYWILSNMYMTPTYPEMDNKAAKIYYH